MGIFIYIYFITAYQQITNHYIINLSQLILIIWKLTSNFPFPTSITFQLKYISFAHCIPLTNYVMIYNLEEVLNEYQQLKECNLIESVQYALPELKLSLANKKLEKAKKSISNILQCLSHCFSILYFSFMRLTMKISNAVHPCTYTRIHQLGYEETTRGQTRLGSSRNK